MSKMLKKDWQDVAKSLKVKFQENDTVKSLQERIAFKMKLKVKKDESLSEAILSGIENMKKAKPAASSKPKTKKKTATPKPKKGDVVVKCNEILDEERRDSLMLTVKGKDVWVKRTQVKVKGKEVTMPKWLADVKGL